MMIEELNKADASALGEKLFTCCGSTSWVKQMLHSRPFSDAGDLFSKAEQAWKNTTEKDWLEAFSHHPEIGDLESLEKKFASTKAMAGIEQASVTKASASTLKQLQEKNRLYKDKFGFIFIVCATGKSAEEMLALLDARFHNTRDAELKIASEEQNKITKLRLQKLVS